MNGMANQSTPIPVKEDDSYEMLKMIQTILDKQNVKLDNINSRFDANDTKMNEMNTQNESNFSELKSSISEINKHLDNTNEKFASKFLSLIHI